MMKELKIVSISGLLLAMAASGFADMVPLDGSVTERLDTLETKTETLFGKAGIYFDGEFRSRALGSHLSGNATKTDAKAKTSEDILFTSVDLSVTARPVDAIGGTFMFRMHEDWRNMFASMSAPVTTRWVSIDGNVKDMFFYSVGDFTQKYSPLTLWAPEPEILFEPTIFARQRELAMGEDFLGGNNRVLQGGNFNFAARITPVIHSIKFGAMAARLREAGQSLGTADYFTAAGADHRGVEMDRYSFAANTDIEFLPSLGLGGTFMYTGDAIGTYNGGLEIQGYGKATKNYVGSGRLQASTNLIAAIDTNVFNARLTGEFAGSNYLRYVLDTLSNSNDEIIKADSTLGGTAFRAGLDMNIGLSGNDHNINIQGNFMRNDQDYRNEMAQSPTLFNRNILNTTNKYSFNTFDALYTTVFSYTPAEGESGIKQPIRKTAWGRGILTWDEMVTAEKLPTDIFDPSFIEQTLSAALPFGEATPDRMGLNAEIHADFLQKAILVAADFKMLNEVARYSDGGGVVKPQQSFTEFAAGASVNFAQLGNWWAYPIILSGSFRMTGVDNFMRVQNAKNDIQFINAGLYYKFWKRIALMGGYQRIGSDAGRFAGREYVKVNTVQQQWAAGFEYAVAEGGVLNATIGQVMVDYSANDPEQNENAQERNNTALRLDLNLTVQF